MKPEDLMIGDWFRFRYTIDGEETFHTFRITLPRRDNGCVWGDDGTGRQCICTPERLEPIPLTPEILEKNGYSRNGLDVALFDAKGEGLRNDFVCAATLEYVHELQHALKLCEINKEIVL